MSEGLIKYFLNSNKNFVAKIIKGFFERKERFLIIKKSKGTINILFYFYSENFNEQK